MQKLHTVPNPALDADGRFTEQFTEFERVLNAVVSGSDGYLPHIQGISGNVVTVECRGDLNPASVAAFTAFGAGTITAVFRILAEGI